MKAQALNTFDELLQTSQKRETRLTLLLKDPTINDTPTWYMCVPMCFNDALDLKLTTRVKDKKQVLVWTQGSIFTFKEGDVLYDTSKAYEEWSEAIKQINLCVQIIKAKEVSPSQGEKERDPGFVVFRILKPDKRRAKLIDSGEYTLTQDDFVRFLISGQKHDKSDVIEKQS